MAIERRRIKCPDTRECFAAVLDDSGTRRCDILRTVTTKVISDLMLPGINKRPREGFYWRDGSCKFCKPRAEYTDGEFYPFDEDYDNHHRSK